MEASARCIQHPAKVATATCSRCGRFVCDDELGWVAEQTVYCDACRLLPEVLAAQGHHSTNRVATAALAMAVAGVVLPFLLPLGFGLAIFGLARVGKTASGPPRTGFAASLGALLLSVVMIAFWLILIFYLSPMY
jgi:hypothetical protein